MIQLTKVTKTIRGATILENVSLSVSSNDKIGLIGPNGAGKSTLCNLLMGIYSPDSGTISRGTEVLGYLPQIQSEIGAQTVDAFLRSGLSEVWEDYKIPMVLEEVDLSIDLSLPFSTLSGGQKTKAGIAKLLLADPTMLILDEPTNNLDTETLQWLERFVRTSSCGVLAISHDRQFLDNTMRSIIELDPHKHTLVSYAGNYSNYRIEKAHRYEVALKTYEEFEEKRREMADWIAKKRVQLSVYRNPKVGSQLQAMKNRYEREFVENAIEKPVVSRDIKVKSFGDEASAKKVMFFVKDLECPLFHIERLSILGADRIHLIGENGVGKSTVLKMLLGENHSFSGEISRGVNVRVGYFSQEHEVLDPQKTVIDEFMDAVQLEDIDKARRILGSFLFRGNAIYKKVSDLSQGEQVRLIIAELAHSNNQFLILDEPTNHLDIESREVLEDALREYEGGFLLVSHDRYFLKNIQINKCIEIKNNQLSARKK